MAITTGARCDRGRGLKARLSIRSSYRSCGLHGLTSTQSETSRRSLMGGNSITDTFGRLREDAETHAHVTLVATMFTSLPLMFTRAYLVHEEAPGRLLFGGRVTMPVWAQAWNVLSAAVLGGLIALGWYQGRQ